MIGLINVHSRAGPMQAVKISGGISKIWDQCIGGERVMPPQGRRKQFRVGQANLEIS